MNKTIKLSNLSEIFSGKKSKKETKDKWIYDNEYRIAFRTKKDKIEFVNHIKRAEKDIKEGRIFSQKEMENYYKEQFGITI